MRFVVPLLFLGLGVTIGSGLMWASENARIQEEPVTCESTSVYTNPQLDCHQEYAIRKSSYDPFRTALVDYIEERKQAGDVDEVSVYFRDLVGGPTFGIDSLQDFAPASLLKLPLGLAYLRIAGQDEGILSDQIRYTKEADTVEQVTKPAQSMELGKWYTVEEALELMLRYSDNIAYGVLREYLAKVPQGPEQVLETYRELGVLDPRSATDETVTVQGYASIFRTLYNASFIDQESSERMLSWLVQGDFGQGIRAGVPASVKVANKFGERVVEDGVVQLHDCGIVYYPSNPYVLCVMTKGNNMESVASVIRDISQRMYAEIDSRKI